MGEKNSRPRSRRAPRVRHQLGTGDDVGAQSYGSVSVDVERLSNGVSRDLLRRQENVDVNWTVSWQTFNPKGATRAEYSTCDAGRGIVTSVEVGYVMVKVTSDSRRKPIQLPRKRLQDAPI